MTPTRTSVLLDSNHLNTAPSTSASMITQKNSSSSPTSVKKSSHHHHHRLAANSTVNVSSSNKSSSNSSPKIVSSEIKVSPVAISPRNSNLANHQSFGGRSPAGAMLQNGTAAKINHRQSHLARPPSAKALKFENGKSFLFQMPIKIRSPQKDKCITPPDPKISAKRIIKVKRRMAYIRFIFERLQKLYTEAMNNEMSKKIKSSEENKNRIAKEGSENLASIKNIQMNSLKSNLTSNKALITKVKPFGDFKTFNHDNLSKIEQKVCECLENSSANVNSNNSWQKFSLLSNSENPMPNSDSNYENLFSLPVFGHSLVPNAIQDDLEKISNFTNTHLPEETKIVQNTHNDPNQLKADKNLLNQNNQNIANTSNNCLTNDLNNESLDQNTDLDCSIIVSTEINGTVFCKGDEVKVLKNGVQEFIGKILVISMTKFLIKGKDSRRKIYTKDLQNKVYTLQFTSET